MYTAHIVDHAGVRRTFCSKELDELMRMIYAALGPKLAKPDRLREITQRQFDQSVVARQLGVQKECAVSMLRRAVQRGTIRKVAKGLYEHIEEKS